MNKELLKRSLMWLGGAVVLLLAALFLMTYAGQFGGARVTGGGQDIMGLVRGQTVDIALRPTNEVRSVKLCSQRRLAGMDDLIGNNCVTLRDYLAPSAVNALVTVPDGFPAGQAQITVHLRGTEGEMPPDSTAFETIPAWIK